ncbi:MAG: biotin--[acetyl-CoA-carboxylase] ligase [Actinomycetota bacterium]|nr:biotin--[acetyl-CoA-carboxylase] ligase [Actinomycetota bacterium]
MIIGRPHIHHRTVGSTNQVARELAVNGAPSGTVVSSEEQTAGRGRQGRPWATPAGSSLAWSAILRKEVEVPGTLPLQVGVAVCEAVEALGVPRAEVKWPNDIWIVGRKCAGILVEARLQEGWVVIGVGLNLSIADDQFPDEIRGRATSVGHGSTIASATDALNRALGARLAAPEHESMAEFTRRDALRGRTVSWAEGTGTAAGIDLEGNLLVQSSAGCLTSLNAGEVHLAVNRPDDA